MARATVLFESEEKRDRQEVAAFLRALADKMAEGQIVLQQGDKQTQLTMPAAVTLEIKAEESARRGRTKRSLEIELEWTEGEESGRVTLG